MPQITPTPPGKLAATSEVPTVKIQILPMQTLTVER